jgi:hypothetical protein
MKLYRIYTENKNLNKVRNLLNVCFECYTIIDGQGTWKSKGEKSIIVELILNGEVNEKRVYAVAESIKTINKQEAVLITAHEVETRLI